MSARPDPRPSLRAVGLLFAALGVSALPAPPVPTAAAAGAAIPPGVHPRLAAAIAVAPADSQTVWVVFSDKGVEGTPAHGLALAEAATRLSPRALERRRRAGVTPLVDERDLPVHGAYLDALAARGAAPKAVSRWLNRAAVRSDGAVLAGLAALPFVRAVLPVERVRLSRPRTEPGGGLGGRGGDGGFQAAGALAPALDQIGIAALHDSGYVGAGVLIALLDEGFNGYASHQALAARPPAPGHTRDFVEGDTLVSSALAPSLHRHGTWCYGQIAGNLPGQYVGAAWGASFALARTEDSGSETPVEMLGWAQGAEWADSLGADIISSSLGYYAFDSPHPSYTYADMDGHTTTVSQAAQIAASKGILVVTAAGNEGDRPWHHLIAPADVDGDSVIAVGAVDAAGAPASFSSYGPSADGRVKPDLAARGVGVPLLSPSVPDGYESHSGTSFSTPLIAGLAACLMQARPSWRPVDVVRALRETASRSAFPDDRVGYGLPDGRAALSWSPQRTSSPPGAPAAGPALQLGPNPFHPWAGPLRISFAAGGAPARVSILDLQGRAVAELEAAAAGTAGWVRVHWDGRDRAGRAVGPGVYLVRAAGARGATAARVVVLP
jgi:hypothetical protein